MLKFINYVINETKFKLNMIPQGVVNFQVNPNVRMDIKKDATNFSLAVTVTISATEERPTPFDLEVKATANFLINGASDVTEMRIEASRLFYPYIRAYISTLTASSNVPAYTLPVIDFAQAIPTSKKVGAQQPRSPLDSIKIRPIDEV